jgi:hypothetical protein
MFMFSGTHQAIVFVSDNYFFMFKVSFDSFSNLSPSMSYYGLSFDACISFVILGIYFLCSQVYILSSHILRALVTLSTSLYVLPECLVMNMPTLVGLAIPPKSDLPELVWPAGTHKAQPMLAAARATGLLYNPLDS